MRRLQTSFPASDWTTLSGSLDIRWTAPRNSYFSSILAVIHSVQKIFKLMLSGKNVLFSFPMITCCFFFFSFSHTLNDCVSGNYLKLEPRGRMVTSWTATEDLCHQTLWNGVVFGISGKTISGALNNLGFILLHQTLALKASSNDEMFLCVET